MEDTIKTIIEESINIKKQVIETLIPEIKRSAETIINSLNNKKKVLICGNGGSSADAQHFAAELIVRFEKNRSPLPAIALTTDSSILTACSNDYGYDNIFKKQLTALGQKGDVLIGITTSGNSPNIINAFKAAKEKNIITLCLNGKNGGKIKELGLADIDIIIPSQNTARIQESHITIIHTLCKLIEDNLYND